MGKETKKQHYVPRCYLKRFSRDGRSINTYDKKQSKTYQASMMAVCYEDSLYTLSDKFVERNNAASDATKVNRLTIEHDYFSKDIEPNLDILLWEIDEIRDDWVSGKERYFLNENEKLEIALHIVSLYFRHPLVMESTVDNSLRAERAMLDMFKMMMATQTGNVEYNKLKIGLEYDKPALSASTTFMSEDFLMDFAKAISNNIYVFWMSTGSDFYTTDFPIVVCPHEENVRPMYMGLAQYGGEIMFPLSPRLALSIYDRECFKADEKLDGCFIEADDKEIRKHNMIHYFYAQRHVFSIKNDFSLIDFIYKYNKNQHIFKTPNHKMSIVSGLGKY